MVAANCSCRVSSHFTGRPVLRTASATRSSVSISACAEAAADAPAEHAHLVAAEAVEIAQRVSRQERDLRAGAEGEAPVRVAPAQAAVGFEMSVLHPLRAERLLVDEIGLAEGRGHVADFAHHLGREVRVPVENRRGGIEGALGVEDGGEDVVGDDERPAPASAAPSLSATTAATRWPAKRRTGSSTRVSAASSFGSWWRPVEKRRSGASSWVSTATTPGIASAAAVSMDTMRAWAWASAAP